jgi:ATP-dependent Clp protease ATP-binding subunit ClpA
MTPPPSLAELIQTVRQDSPSDGSLDLLVTASSTVSQLEELNDALMEHFIDRCRREGKSWSEISAALGVSKQAVHKRFAGPIADRIAERLTGSREMPTFERFTARARGALAGAALAAGERGGAAVDSGDLLLGLFSEPEGLAAKVLTAMGTTADAVRAARPAGTTPAAGPAGGAPAAGAPAAGSAAAGAPAAGSAAGGRVPFGPDTAPVLRDAVVEALELGHNYIGTEHILLGLLRDPDSPGAGLLRGLGISPKETRVRLSELLRGFRQPGGAKAADQEAGH